MEFRRWVEGFYSYIKQARLSERKERWSKVHRLDEKAELKAHTLPGSQKQLSDSVSLEARLPVQGPLSTDPTGFPRCCCV